MLGRRLRTAKSHQIWKRELPSEIAFWEEWISEEVIPWQEERRARLDPKTPLQDWYGTWSKHLQGQPFDCSMSAQAQPHYSVRSGRSEQSPSLRLTRWLMSTIVCWTGTM